MPRGKKLPPQPDGRVDQSGLAKNMGLDRRTVSDYVKRKQLILDNDGLIHPDNAREQLQEKLHPRAKVNLQEAKPGKIDYQTAKTMREIAEARIANLKFQEMEKTLIKKEIVRKAVFDVVRGLRDNMGVMSRRLSVDVMAVKNVQDCESLLRKEINNALNYTISEFERQL